MGGMILCSEAPQTGRGQHPGILCKLKRLELPCVYAELLAQSQGPAFLQPGQLGDQIPMAVSRDRSQGDASRQQNGSAQMDAEQATLDALQSSEAGVAMGRPGAGVHRAGTCLAPAMGMASPVTVKLWCIRFYRAGACLPLICPVCVCCWPHGLVSLADAQSGGEPLADRAQGELQGVAIGVAPERALLTVVIPPLQATVGSRPGAANPGRPTEEHHDTPEA